MPNMERIVVVDEWSGKFNINEAYRLIAQALVEKFRELRHIPVKSILFLDNTEDSGKSRDRVKNAQIGKVPEKWQELIYQMTGRAFLYFMEFFKKNTEHMSREQIVALVYHELRHIDTKGDLCHHDIEDWGEMIRGLGVNWSSTKSMIPDLLDDDVDWDNITVPSLFDERRLKAVK